MATTQRFGFDKFGGALGGSIADDNGKFSNADRDTLDRVLSAFEVHAHAAGQAARLADPSGAPTAELGTTGALPAGATYYYRVSYLDAYGLETGASAEVSVVTPAPVDPPLAPAAVADASGGTLAPGLYYWAGTAIQNGVETPLGDSVLLTVPAGSGEVTLTFPALPAGADSIGVWRQGPSDAGFTKIGTVTGTTFLDNGSVESDPCACDPTKMPPTTNQTGATSSVTVTVPAADEAAVGAYPAAGITRWRLYRTQTSGLYPASSLVHEVVETTDGTPGTGLVTSWVDDGSSPPVPGAPLTQSQTLQPSIPIVVPSPSDIAARSLALTLVLGA